MKANCCQPEWEFIHLEALKVSSANQMSHCGFGGSESKRLSPRVGANVNPPHSDLQVVNPPWWRVKFVNTKWITSFEPTVKKSTWREPSVRCLCWVTLLRGWQYSWCERSCEPTVKKDISCELIAKGSTNCEPYSQRYANCELIVKWSLSYESIVK